MTSSSIEQLAKNGVEYCDKDGLLLKDRDPVPAVLSSKFVDGGEQQF